MKWKKDTRGMTLVEVMAGAAILIIASLLLASGFLAVSRVMGEGDRLKRAGELAGGNIDQTANASTVSEETQNARAQFTINGLPFDIAGAYRTATEENAEDFAFKVFETNAMLSPRDMYNRMKAMPGIYDALTAAEKTQLQSEGIKTYKGNDSYRGYLFKRIYQNNWPMIPEEQLPEELKGIPQYVQPFMANPANSESCPVLIFANSKNILTGDWNTRLIYDHEHDCWFLYTKQDAWGKKVSFKMTTLNVNPSTGTSAITWEELHQQMHMIGGDWLQLNN